MPITAATCGTTKGKEAANKMHSFREERQARKGRQHDVAAWPCMGASGACAAEYKVGNLWRLFETGLHAQLNGGKNVAQCANRRVLLSPASEWLCGPCRTVTRLWTLWWKWGRRRRWRWWRWCMMRETAGGAVRVGPMGWEGWLAD